MSASANQSPIPPTVVSIGNFDGVHLGHQALVREARELAGSTGRVVLLVFDPHPVTVLKSEGAAPARLTCFAERERLLLAAGVDAVVRLEPTEELLNQTAVEFVDWLRLEFGMTGIVEGPDFRFGKDRSGDMTLLKTLGIDAGFSVRILNPVEIALDDQTMVRASSTMARWLLGHGRVRDVANLLGRTYQISGEVVAGAGRGRTIGVPTANVATRALLPAGGVYAGRARDLTHGNSSWYRAAINVGTRPTFGTDQAETCEVHLLGFAGEIGDYGWDIEVEFTSFLRDEMRFDSAGEVVVQIERDIARVGSRVGDLVDGVSK